MFRSRPTFSISTIAFVTLAAGVSTAYLAPRHASGSDAPKAETAKPVEHQGLVLSVEDRRRAGL